MKPIQPPIRLGDAGEPVFNLRAALLFLLQRGAVKALEYPNQPTVNELTSLAQKARSEQDTGQAYLGAARQVTLYLQLQLGLGDGFGGDVEDQTASELNRLLGELGGLDTPEAYVVKGRVVDEQGRGLPGVPVRLFDEDVTGPVPIAQPTTTAADGRYRFNFDADAHTEGDFGELPRPAITVTERVFSMLARPRAKVTVPSSPDLWVGVGPEADNLLARTEIVFNAGPQTQMPDLVLTRSALHQGLSDLERVLGLVSPRLKGLALPALTPPQAEFLARDCEEPLALVKALVAAARSEEQAQKLASELDLQWIDAAALLFALQFTITAEQDGAGLEQVLALGNDDVVRQFEDGFARNRIPKTLAGMIKAFVPWLAELRARHRLAGKTGDRKRPFGPALATLPDGLRPEGKALLGVAKALDFWGRDPARFTEALREAGLDDRQTFGVMRTLALSDLTGGHVPLVGLLQVGDPKPEHAVLLDVAGLSRERWKAAVEKAKLPTGIDDGEAYVTGLLRGIEQRAPTAYVMARIGDGRIPFEPALLEPASTFSARNPDFRFGSDSVFARFGEPGAVDDVPEDQVQPLLQELLRVERIARVTPNLEAAEIMIGLGYGSAYEITRRGEEDFVEELKAVLPGGEAEARTTYAKARSVREGALAIYLAVSPQANGVGQVQLLSGTTSPGGNGTVAPAPMVTRSAMTGTGAAAQTATLEALFGNQDACACEDCSAMGSPSHYLAELLNLLDSSPSRTGGTGLALGKLLERRPDLAEIELDCENAGRTIPYVDLLLELIEAPIIEGAPLNVIPRTSQYDASLDAGVVPAGLRDELLERAGIDLGENAKAQRRSSTVGQGHWLVTGEGWRLLVRGSTYGAYRFRVFPQSGGGALPESWSFPAPLLDHAYQAPATARYPWTLPFDLAESETDAWLSLLSTSLRAIGNLGVGAASSAARRAARLSLRMPEEEWKILTLTGPSATAWGDWGYSSESFSVSVGGVSQLRRWDQDLQTVSTFKRRTGLSHLEVLDLLQCRFIQPTQPPRLTLSGDECNGDQMRLGDPAAGSALLDAERLRRIHLFVRLWRRLNWPMRDLDRTLATFSRPDESAAYGMSVFTSSFLEHVANVVRISEYTGLGPELALAIFKPELDTQTYWRQEGARAFAIPSTYDRLFSDPTLNRPRAPAFELNGGRNGLLPTSAASEFPQLRLSDHLAVIAGALGCTAADVQALLPRGEVSIDQAVLTDQKTTADGTVVELPKTGDVVFEIVLGTVSGNATATVEWRFLAPDGNGNFINIQPSELGLTGQPLQLKLPADGQRVHRFTYRPGSTRAGRVKVQAIRTTGTAQCRLAARVLTDPGLVTDELTLTHLSLLTRHLLMARAGKLGGAAYRSLLELWGADPLQSPAAALDFLEQLSRLRSQGPTPEGLDEWLRERFQDKQAEQRAQTQVCEALEAVRGALAAQDAELTMEPGQAETTLVKALLEAGWPQRLVDLVVSAEVLDPDLKAEHQAKLPDLDLPDAALPLPEGLAYESQAGLLKFSAPLARAEQALKAAGEKLLPRLQPDVRRKVEAALKELATSVTATEKRARSHAARLLLLAQSLTLPVFEAVVTDESSTSVLRAVAIPESWAGTLWFDAAQRALCFKGPMTAEWRDELKRLSISGIFRSAIDRLFRQASAFREPANRSVFSPPDARGAYKLIAQSPRGVEQHAAVMLQRVMPMLRVHRAVRRVAAVLEPRLGVSTPLAHVLLDRYQHAAGTARLPLVGQGIDNGVLMAPDFVRSPTALRITPQGFPVQYAALRRMFKLAVIAQASKLDPTEADWLVGPWPGSASSGASKNLAALLPTEAQATVPADLRAAWRRWSSVIAARQRLGNTPSALAGYIRATQAAGHTQAVREIANWAGAPAEEVRRLLDGLDAPNTAQSDEAARLARLRDPDRMLHLVQCLDWMRTTGCDAASLLAWSGPSLGMAAAARARQFARARVGEAAWPEVSRKPLNELRVKRRDALVTYEVHRRNLADANELYGQLLVDPEMGACMQTTRTRLAISSVQLFVQRIQLGLEQENGLARNTVDAQQWAWMQNYRLWEANLKVLLHSENYLDMSLRREKTPPYRALEADLMQGDITTSRASAALATYLDQLEEVSRLQTVGMYRDTPTHNGWPVFERQTLCFVGATQTEPKKHFLRRFVRHGLDARDGTWTPWERIELDLQEMVTVSPVVRARETLLFWLEFREQAQQRLPQTPESSALPARYWVPTLRWSTEQQSKWTSPRSWPIKLGLGHTDYVISATATGDLDTSLDAVETRTGFTLDLWFLSANTIQSVLIRPPSIGSASTNSNSPLPPPPVGLVANQRSVLIDWDAMTLGGVPVFAAGRNSRVVISHQDIRHGLRFRAPGAASVPGQQPAYPCNFVFDSGRGEVLVQPRHENLTTQRFLEGQAFPVTINLIGGAQRLVLSAAHHPQASDFRRILRTAGLAGLISLDAQRMPAAGWYLGLKPDRNTIPPANDPDLDVDFRLNGSYAPYNWELFFMIPFAVACELSKQQRFREARDWFHYVFNPTEADSSTTGGKPTKPGQQFWRFRPFREWDSTASIQTLVRKLADPNHQSPEKADFLAAIEKWRQDPFDPHLVARFRPVAYQMAVVMAYLKNLIAWGDQFFRRDTMESLNEAAQLYILASEILGRLRELIPPRTRPVRLAFFEMKAAMAANSGAQALSNPLVAAESVLPLGVTGSSSTQPLPEVLHFCVPSNPAFEQLRQTVQDRLFKLRSCKNIDGVERQLALFEPPIDPAMLVRARAAGIDVAALLAETSAPPPLYRFQVLAQKASEVCAEVKSLGAALLSALEKGDAEALARLRSEHEEQVLASVRQIKQLQIDEAEARIKALDPSLEAASRRLHYYVGLLTQVEEMAIPTGAAGPTVGSLLTAAIKTVTAAGSVATVVTGLANPVATAAAVALNQAISRATEALSNQLAANEASTSKVPMNPAEKNQLVQMQIAREAQNKANDLRLVAQLLAKIPDFKAGVSGAMGSPVATLELGGSLLSSAANFLATMEDAKASEHSHRAGLYGMLAGYQRRAADWMQQALQAKADIEQLTLQLAATTLDAAIKVQDLRNHDQLMANAAQLSEWNYEKYTNRELFSWMSQQVSGVYLRSYQLAYDLAKRAERAYQHELGVDSSAFVRTGHWDGLKKGLLAGELLFHDIKRMEAAYLDANVREFEITRSISLRQLDVAELMALRIDGQCSFVLPEWLFNMDYPDHYQRRIKSVAVSLPCVVGPYAGVNGKLTLLSGKVRVSATPGQRYDDESNFRSSQIGASSIAVSSAQGEAGLFEFNLRDERYLPFEGAGLADSRWHFELPRHLRQFDYDTIADLVLTVRYTARSSVSLRQAAIDHLNEQLRKDAAARILVDVRRDFAAQWAKAVSAATSPSVTLKLEIARHHLPYVYARRASIGSLGHLAWMGSGQGGTWRKSPPSVGTDVEQVDDDRWSVKVVLPAPPAPDDELILGLAYSMNEGA